jgi:hypothetical protein
MGLLGNAEIVPFLQTLLVSEGPLNLSLYGTTIMGSLYLITGESKFPDTATSQKEVRFRLSEEELQARRVVAASKGRRRTHDEMIILDEIFRRPGW